MVRSAIGINKRKRSNGLSSGSNFGTPPSPMFASDRSNDICSMEDDDDTVGGTLDSSLHRHQSSLHSFFAKVSTSKTKATLMMATPKAAAGPSTRITPSPRSKFDQTDNSSSISSSGDVNTYESRTDDASDRPATFASSLSHSKEQSTSSLSPPPSSTAIQTQQQQKQRQRPLTQVYIDCGQSTFGQILCKRCGMLYMPGIREDERRHGQLCQAYTLGIPCVQGTVINGKQVERTREYVVIQWKTNSTSARNCSSSCNSTTPAGNGRRVASDAATVGNSTVTTTTSNLPSQWPLLARMISKDLGMEESTTLKHLAEQVVFLYVGRTAKDGRANGRINDAPHSNSGVGTGAMVTPPPNRILGVVTVHVISHAYRMPTPHDRSLVPEKATLGVGLLWTHPSSRHGGVATRLVTAARQHAIFGMRVPTHHVAFSSPTQAGYAFAQRYCFNAGGSGMKSTDDSVGPLVYEM